MKRTLGGFGGWGAGSGGGGAAAAALLRIDLVLIIIGLEGGQFDGHPGATVTTGGRGGGAAAAALGALIVVIIEIRIESGPGRIRTVALDGGTQHRGSQSSQELWDNAVRLVVDLLQQPRGACTNLDSVVQVHRVLRGFEWRVGEIS